MYAIRSYYELTDIRMERRGNLLDIFISADGFLNR